MVKYFCDRCGNEISKEQYNINPNICQYKEKLGNEFTVIQTDCKLCISCMRKYILFIGGKKDVK